MGIGRRLNTAMRVLRTFGMFELVKISARKVLFRNKFNLVLAPPTGIKIYEAKDWTDSFFSQLLGVSEPAVNLARKSYVAYQSTFEKKATSPRTQFFDSDFDLGKGMSEFLFTAILTVKPKKILETGVAAGISTNTILRALSVNGSGELYSVDITDQVGELVDEDLKFLWSLEVLPEFGREKAFIRFLRENHDVSFFLHDSDHSGSWQIKEFTHVVTELPSVSLLCFDDIGQDLIDFILLHYKNFRITVLNEGKKFSGIIHR